MLLAPVPPSPPSAIVIAQADVQKGVRTPRPAPPPTPAEATAASGDTRAVGDASAIAAIPAPTRPLPTPGGVAPMALLRATLAAASPLLAAGPWGVRPADGLWVLATARCPLPNGTDLNAWADCTQPIGFNGGELAVLEKPRGNNKAAQTGGLYSIARTRYRTAAFGSAPFGAPGERAYVGAPGAALVQVDVPGVTGRTYVYVAVRPEVVDGEGRMVAARAWPVNCPAAAAANVSHRGDRCFASTLQAVKDAAAARPGDGGYVLRWIDPTDADVAGDTTGARAYAAPPPPVFRRPKKLTPLEAATPLPISDLPPYLAAQQPAAPDYAPRDEGDDAPARPARKPARR